MSHFMTAAEANNLSLQVNNATSQGVLSNLRDALKKIEGEAFLGKNSTFIEGYGKAVKFQDLIAALQALGYNVIDVSNQPTGIIGSKYLDRSIAISW